MKFYSEDTPGLIVWDKEKKKILCQFVKGEFETEDKRIIGILSQNYKYSGEILTPKQELQKEADLYAIEYSVKTTIKQLEGKIAKFKADHKEDRRM